VTKPTFEQTQHFYRLVEEGKITRANFQAFLEKPTKFVADFFATTVNNGVGLISLIKLAVGPNNLSNINSDITPERFKLGEGVRDVKLQVLPYLDGETSEDCAKRLVSEGHTLENTGELAAFLAQHPEEVERWSWVFALGEASRWEHPDGSVSMPCAGVDGTDRGFDLDWFGRQCDSRYGVLVSVSSK